MEQVKAALVAWHQILPGAPDDVAVEILKPRNRKSAVYRLIGAGAQNENVIAKRCSRSTADHEEKIYRLVLSRLPVPTLSLYGVIASANGRFSWMFLQDASDAAFEMREQKHRETAAHWLAALHSFDADDELRSSLPDRGQSHYLEILDVAHDVPLSALENPVLQRDERFILADLERNCRRLKQRSETIREICGALPASVVHGDMGAKNLRMGGTAHDPVLLPLDWETSGWGCAAMDLSIADLATYQKRLSRGGLNRALLENAARIGRVFWCLAPMRGHASSLMASHVTRIMNKMRFYQGEVAAAMTDSKWVE
jgi:hypothetical protein